MFMSNKKNLNVIELNKYIMLKEVTIVWKFLGLITCTLGLIYFIMICFGNSLNDVQSVIALITLLLFLFSCAYYLYYLETEQERNAKLPLKDLYLNMLNSESRELFKKYLTNGQIITMKIFNDVLAQEIQKENQMLKTSEIQRQLEVLNND